MKLNQLLLPPRVQIQRPIQLSLEALRERRRLHPLEHLRGPQKGQAGTEPFPKIDCNSFRLTKKTSDFLLWGLPILLHLC